MYRTFAASYALISLTHLAFAISALWFAHAIYEFYFAFAALDAMMSAVYGSKCRRHADDEVAAVEAPAGGE